VIVIDPYTGEILAMASFPGYNPNDYGDSEPASRRDRGLSDVFEPPDAQDIHGGSRIRRWRISPTQKLSAKRV
jgi:cell division protein FtsI (penicillin-binding protein 3)